MKNKILLIDDTESLLEFYRFQLETEFGDDVVTVTAINGADAFKKIDVIKEESDFLCVITDYEMQIMNGEEFSIKLRDTWKDVNIFLHTNTYKDQIEGLTDKLKDLNINVMTKDQSMTNKIMPWIKQSLKIHAI